MDIFGMLCDFRCKAAFIDGMHEKISTEDLRLAIARVRKELRSVELIVNTDSFGSGEFTRSVGAIVALLTYIAAARTIDIEQCIESAHEALKDVDGDFFKEIYGGLPRADEPKLYARKGPKK